MSNKAIKPLSDIKILNLRLREAVETFDVGATEALLAAGANPNTKTAWGNPLVYVAAAMNKSEIVEAFIRVGANKNALGRKGIDAAGITGSKKIKEYLLASPDVKKTRITLKVKNITGAIKKAVGDNNYLNTVDEQGNTPLHLAIITGSVGHVKAMLKAGVNTHIKNKNGATALHLAAMSKSKAILDLIISKTHKGERP